MSQKKVDQYKESKKTRKQDIAKQKRRSKVTRAVVAVVCAALVIFICASIATTFVIPAIQSSISSELDKKYADLDSQLIVATDTDAE
ncbi:MAG: hypothetical protein LUE29_03665 [Lachnospiraceae bacterium]|nr:hypothetical protein [Lachnospiraceae bacterium]